MERKMLKSERFMVIDQNNHIYFNEFGSDEEIMTLEDAKWLAYKLSDGAEEDRLKLKVFELVEV
jgi:hypothetical protein